MNIFQQAPTAPTHILHRPQLQQKAHNINCVTTQHYHRPISLSHCNYSIIYMFFLPGMTMVFLPIWCSIDCVPPCVLCARADGVLRSGVLLLTVIHPTPEYWYTPCNNHHHLQRQRQRQRNPFEYLLTFPFGENICHPSLSDVCQPKMVAFHIISVQATTGPPPSIWLLHSGAAAVTNDWKRCCAVQKWCRAGGVDRYWYNFSYLLIPIHSILEHATFFSILLHIWTDPTPRNMCYSRTETSDVNLCYRITFINIHLMVWYQVKWCYGIILWHIYCLGKTSVQKKRFLLGIARIT